MAKVEITPHAKQRTLERIDNPDVGEFCSGVRKGTSRLSYRKKLWAVKVIRGFTCLGYAVGEGTVWKTTLSGGQTVDPDSEIVEVKV